MSERSRPLNPSYTDVTQAVDEMSRAIDEHFRDVLLYNYTVLEAWGFANRWAAGIPAKPVNDDNIMEL